MLPCLQHLHTGAAPVQVLEMHVSAVLHRGQRRNRPRQVVTARMDSPGFDDFELDDAYYRELGIDEDELEAQTTYHADDIGAAAANLLHSLRSPQTKDHISFVAAIKSDLCLYLLCCRHLQIRMRTYSTAQPTWGTRLRRRRMDPRCRLWTFRFKPWTYFCQKAWIGIRLYTAVDRRAPPQTPQYLVQDREPIDQNNDTILFAGSHTGWA